MVLIHSLILAILMGFTQVAMSADSVNPFLGSWKFIGYIYHNEFKPPINPKLVLTFQFNQDKTDSLFWMRQDEPGFCERKGIYNIENGILNDEVTWINPNNNTECAQDPDMQLGKKASNEIKYVDGYLQLNLGLSGEPFYYVFEKISKN